MTLSRGTLPAAERKQPEVDRLIDLGRERGYLLYEEIQQALSEQPASPPEELEKFYLRARKLGIEVSNGSAAGAHKSV